jgi:formylglycine-generating enzyme required for sulfatase activity
VRAGSTATDGTPLFDEEVCVPGGAFLFGNAETDARDDVADAPVRLALLPPFRMDRYEVTVGRWRAALADGFKPLYAVVPQANESALASDTGPVHRECTWSVTPQKRETYPLTCIDHASARAFCQFLGGDLPTEAQWEYVAESVGRDSKTLYPWGDDPAPTCKFAIYARDETGTSQDQECRRVGFGPAPVDTMAQTDVAPGTGIIDLGGNVSEIQLDSFHSFLTNCWASNGLDSPRCIDPSPMAETSIRGAGWKDPSFNVRIGWREFTNWNNYGSGVGFRCVRAIQ